ncbi:MAG: hypothetical protein FJW26_22055 [Acidimicrobiia bacterium]|nr:hypothetical protein [Acidimicrobiia bacterium]
MKVVKTMIAMVLAVTILPGCGGKPSTEELAKEVQSHIEEKWASEPELATARITSFKLVHKGGQQYRGLLEATKDGESVTLGVDVTYDGESFMWEIAD